MVPPASDWVALLRAASGEAESTQHALAQALRDYAASPSQHNRARLDRASRLALVKESEFDALWRLAVTARADLGRRP